MKKIFLIIISFLTSFSMAANNLNSALLKDVKSGNFKTIKSYKGKIYIKLWASWCPVCLNSLPHTKELSMDRNKDFNVITIISPNNINELSLNDFKKWWNTLTEFKDITVLADEKGYIIDKIKLRGYPSNIFIDSKGNIVKVLPGAISNEQIKSIFRNIK